MPIIAIPFKYGCQVNVNDSAILLEHGYHEEFVDEVNANIWLTNTCAIPNKAKQNNFII
jgi:tRNA A37 methylthiotransferase MiaB